MGRAIVMVDTKNMTLRLPREQAADVEALARVEGVTVTEEIRRALVDRIEAKRQDPEFRARLAEAVEDNAAALRRLADS